MQVALQKAVVIAQRSALQMELVIAPFKEVCFKAAFVFDLTLDASFDEH